jgi:thymidylate kinase
MKYITIDGLSGSGKSTNGIALAKMLDWEEKEANCEGEKDVYRMLTSVIEKGFYPYSLISQKMQTFMVLRALIDAQKEPFVLTSYFWNELSHFYYHPNDGNIRQMLNVFLELFADKLPVASFFLKVDTQTRYQRIFERESREDGYFKVNCIDIDVSENKEDERALKFFEWLQSEVDVVPIYIIDNTNVSINEVTTQILEKIW